MGTVGVGIEKISISDVHVVHTKDDADWYHSIFVVTLTNKKRMRIKTEKQFWHVGDYQLMMNKTRAAIHGKVESLGINVNVGKGRAYMTTECPWKYLWLYIEIKANIHQIESMRLNNAALSRVKSKGDSIHAKDWEHGEDFTNRGRKCHARSSVMDELEMRSGKQLAKAECIYPASYLS